MTNTKIKILTGANAFSPSALKKLTTAFNSHNKTSAIFHAKEVFLIQSKNGYLLDCDNKFTNDIIHYLSKYKLRSKVEIKDITSKYVIGLISLERFLDIQKKTNLKNHILKISLIKMLL